MKAIIFDNKYIIKSEEVAENFNTYFIDSIEQIVIPPTPDQVRVVLDNMYSCECRMEEFVPLSFTELRATVGKMKNKKSSIDGISTKILKLSHEVIGDRFLHLINCILERGTFPQTWKTTTIVPIKKRQALSDVKNTDL